MANRLTVTRRRWLLSTHILTSAGWLGASLCFLVLSIVAANARDENTLHAAYTTMNLLDRTLVRPLAVSTAVTGVLLSVLTQWGLFKFHWVVAKEVLTALSIGLGIILMNGAMETAISMISTGGLNALGEAAFSTNANAWLIGVVFQVVALLLSIILSVFKPGRQTSQQSARDAYRNPIMTASRR